MHAASFTDRLARLCSCCRPEANDEEPMEMSQLPPPPVGVGVWRPVQLHQAELLVHQLQAAAAGGSTAYVTFAMHIPARHYIGDTPVLKAAALDLDLHSATLPEQQKMTAAADRITISEEEVEGDNDRASSDSSCCSST